MALTVPQALQLLQLQPGATKKQIRAAYKRLALQLHPDKQQQQQQQNQPRQCEATAAFALLSAAYSLLMQGCRQHQQQQQQHQAGCWQGQDHPAWAPFETQYATGALFSERLVDEAVEAGLGPMEIAALQHLADAACAGQLADHLRRCPPTDQDEALWRQLHTRLELKQRVRQQQQQQQHGVGLGELLSDLLLRPSGPLLVADSEDEDEDDVDVHQQQQELALVAGAAAPGAVAQQQQQQQQQQGHASSEQPQGQLQPHASAAAAGPNAVGGGSSGGRRQRLRHGWGFYWLWLRRALLAKAVLSVVATGLKAQLHEYRYPQPL